MIAIKYIWRCYHEKIILLILSVSLILTGCRLKDFSKISKLRKLNNFENTENTVKSLNGFLKYKLPKGQKEILGGQVKTEIAVEKESDGLMVEYLEYSNYTQKKFY